MNSNDRLTPQGYFLGVPYDLRRPTARRILARVWCPGGPLFPPHAFGWGYSLNLAHPGAWALGALAILTLLLV